MIIDEGSHYIAPKGYAPLAQLVEQLTLNQWVPGSNPWRCTTKVSVFIVQGPPVPIPNTVVKLYCADNTWLATVREDRSMLTQKYGKWLYVICHKYSSLAQSVERMTVNHDVAGSSPAGGARKKHLRKQVLFSMKRTYGAWKMKQGFALWSVASPHGKVSVRFASCEHRERIVATKLPLHIAARRCFIKTQNSLISRAFRVFRGKNKHSSTLHLFPDLLDLNPRQYSDI